MAEGACTQGAVTFLNGESENYPLHQAEIAGVTPRLCWRGAKRIGLGVWRFAFHCICKKYHIKMGLNEFSCGLRHARIIHRLLDVTGGNKFLLRGFGAYTWLCRMQTVLLALTVEEVLGAHLWNACLYSEPSQVCFSLSEVGPRRAKSEEAPA